MRRDGSRFCKCSLHAEKGDKETAEGGPWTKAITATEAEGSRDRHRFRERSPAGEMVNGEHAPAEEGTYTLGNRKLSRTGRFFLRAITAEQRL